jgi:hypothetical protein
MNLNPAAALALAAMLTGLACQAQPAPKPAPPAAPAADTSTGTGTGTPEPKVQQTVVEDDGARIEELKVRGHTQRIVVSPKRGGTAPYEIITGDGSRDLGDGANTSRGAAGKRVWNVLKF